MYLRQVAAALAGALVLAGAVATDATAQRRDRDDDRRSEREGRRGGFDPDWVLLGEKAVGFRVDRDVINIGHGEDWYRERRFRELRFVADRNDVHMMSIRLVYHNGFAEDFRVDRLIRQGDSLPLDLRGERSFIRRIEMVYRSRPGARGRAEVAVFGLRDFALPPLPPPVSWVELGCGKVGIKPDRDSIRVGRREGRFSAIKLAVRGSKIELIDLTVVYERGPPDELQVRKKIGDGDETPPFDLRGERRAIDRVDLTYRQTLGLNMIKGPARVCVLGR